MQAEEARPAEQIESAAITEVMDCHGYTHAGALNAILHSKMNVAYKDGNGKINTRVYLPGVYLNSLDTGGPVQHRRIMLVSPWPNMKEAGAGRMYSGEWTNELERLADATGFPMHDIYLTAFCKYAVDGKKPSIPKDIVEAFDPIMRLEVELVKPELVILMGAKSLKAVFGAKATYESYKNRTIPATESPLGVATTVIPDPAAILSVPEMRDVIQMDLVRITRELSCADCASDIVEDYRYVSTFQDLEREVDTIIAEYDSWLAVDCEWGGSNHLDGELRSIQFSWAAGKALVVVFNKAGMMPTELGADKARAWECIKRLVSYKSESKRTRLIGHFIRADLPWLVHNGLDVTMPTLFGWDTALAGHLLNENWPQGLETYVARHTDMGRYEVPLNQWMKDNKYDVDDLGYGGIPDDVLFPYAAKDADATYRIAMQQIEEMSQPGNEKIRKLLETVVMPASMPILEMEMTGMKLDKDRLFRLAQIYTAKRQDLVHKLQELLQWPDFNPDSPGQKAAALFGWKDKANPPKTALLCHYTPLKATNGAKWENRDDKRLDSYVPSTDRSVLQGLLVQHPDCPVLNAVLMYTAVAQTVKTFTGEFVETPEGDCHLEGGIYPKAWSDGRVHARIRQTVETGRYGHSNPNMAQLPKTAESLVAKAFDGQGVDSIRSCFVADEGWCLLDCDWVQAELFVMAWLSGDKTMQAKLSDKGSDFHSEVAIQMFRLASPGPEYTEGKKAWLKQNNWTKYRTIAKTITFGIAYGRGAAAIKDAVGLEGVSISMAEAEDAVAAFKDTFPTLTAWLAQQQSKVLTQGYVENGFGRRRRFVETGNGNGADEQLAHQRRQAMNAPIQGTVGDLMSLALSNLYMQREGALPHLKYRILMSVHDQIIVTCPVDQVKETLEVMQVAMCDHCRIPGNDLVLGIDPEVCIRWGEPLTDGDVERYPELKPYKH